MGRMLARLGGWESHLSSGGCRQDEAAEIICSCLSAGSNYMRGGRCDEGESLSVGRQS